MYFISQSETLFLLEIKTLNSLILFFVCFYAKILCRLVVESKHEIKRFPTAKLQQPSISIATHFHRQQVWILRGTDGTGAQKHLNFFSFQALHQKILQNFIIVRKKDLMWKTEDSEKFYAEHAGRKGFFCPMISTA